MNLLVKMNYVLILAAIAFIISISLVALVTEADVPFYWLRRTIANDIAWNGSIYILYPTICGAIAISYAMAKYAFKPTARKIGIIFFIFGIILIYFTTLSIMHTTFMLISIMGIIAYDWAFGPKVKS